MQRITGTARTPPAEIRQSGPERRLADVLSPETTPPRCVSMLSIFTFNNRQIKLKRNGYSKSADILPNMPQF
jgi:hypothetical protein